MQNTINPQMLRSMLEVVNKCDQPVVHVAKPVMRAILFEMIRLIEIEKVDDNSRASYVQALTMEYAAMHMADLMTGLLDSDMKGITLRDVVTFAVQQLEEMANDVSVKTVGAA